jgi:hypothetical protein
MAVVVRAGHPAVMAGLVPAIHALRHRACVQAWMPGTSPGHDEIPMAAA